MAIKKQSIEAILRELVRGKGLRTVAHDLRVDPASLYRSLLDNSNLKWGRIKRLLDYFGYEF
jgi:DNA-binding phage protein